MAVCKSNFNIVGALCCLVFAAFSVASPEGSNKNEVLDLLSRKILTATANYGKRIEQCDLDKQRNSVPKLSEKKLKLLEISREEAVSALAHLQFENYFRCVEKEQLTLGYYLESMANLREKMGDTEPQESLQSQIVYPSEKELKLELDFMNLSEGKKKYFKRIVKDRVFDLYTSLEVNQLLVK